MKKIHHIQGTLHHPVEQGDEETIVKIRYRYYSGEGTYVSSVALAPPDPEEIEVIDVEPPKFEEYVATNRLRIDELILEDVQDHIARAEEEEALRNWED